MFSLSCHSLQIDSLPALPPSKADAHELVSKTRVMVSVEGLDRQTPLRAGSGTSLTFSDAMELLFDINRRSMQGSLEDSECIVVVEHRVSRARRRPAFRHGADPPVTSRRVRRPARRIRTRKWKWRGVLRTLLGSGAPAVVGLVAVLDTAAPDGVPSEAAIRRVLSFRSAWRVHEFLWWSAPGAAEVQLRALAEGDAEDIEARQIELDAAEAAYIQAKVAQHSIGERSQRRPYSRYCAYVSNHLARGFAQDLALL
jgi:hypothetical protein